MMDLFDHGIFIMIIQIIIGLSVLALFVAIFIDFVKFSGKTKVKKEKKSIVETGTMTLFYLVFCIILQSGSGIIPVQSRFIKAMLMVLGTVMIVSGCIANIKGRFNLGGNWANQTRIYEQHTLVQSGMYRFVRHPLYASIIFMFYGACLVYRNIFCFIAVSVVFVPFMVYRASQEERLLMQRFPEYDEYRRRTGMLFPKVFRGS